MTNEDKPEKPPKALDAIVDKVLAYRPKPKTKPAFRVDGKQLIAHVRLVTPVGRLMKHEIVKQGVKLGVPYDLTWSCYSGGDRHCGECGPCTMRSLAFQRNGRKDPVFNQWL